MTKLRSGDLKTSDDMHELFIIIKDQTYVKILLFIWVTLKAHNNIVP